MAANYDKSQDAVDSQALPNARENASSLAESVGFDILGEGLGRDIERALTSALGGGAVFHSGTNALSVFRNALAASVRSMETHPKGQLFKRFLRDGPYEGDGDIPSELRGQRLNDEETTSVIAFVYSFMVNSFKGAVTELFASEAIVQFVQQLRQTKALPMDSQVYMGDAVMVRRKSGKGVLKGADAYLLVIGNNPSTGPNVTVAGVAEVKSGPKSAASMSAQLDKHIRRGSLGLEVAGTDYPAEQVRIGQGPNSRLLRITVQPSEWKLPRGFHFETRDKRKYLQIDSPPTPKGIFNLSNKGDDAWHISLGWSQEAIAEAAYGMTFWYMERVGEAIFSESRPKGWEEMSPAEAGQNAAKMMLYYAILRCRTDRERQRAIALYNSYGFGCALGMNFRNRERKREMLWPEDLDEILLAGKTRKGSRIL